MANRRGRPKKTFADDDGVVRQAKWTEKQAAVFGEIPPPVRGGGEGIKTGPQLARAVLEAFGRRGGVKYLVGLEDKYFIPLLKKVIPAKTITERTNIAEKAMEEMSREELATHIRKMLDFAGLQELEVTDLKKVIDVSEGEIE